MKAERKISVAAVQAAFGDDMEENLQTVEKLIRDAAAAGAQVILPPELFQGPYFCKSEEESSFSYAYPADEHPATLRMQVLARELGVAIPVSIFEREGNHYYNSLVMVDADGANLGTYRKSHIPDGPGYEEKYYFRPGNTGFKVWKTRFGNLGVGICWDQWFPESARAMMLQGAEILFYPTAIGSEPTEPDLETKDLWQRAMVGHAVSNVVPVVAANRIGDESGQIFYGHSFISNHRGALVEELPGGTTGFIVHQFDLEAIHLARASFGFFRDRRPELYSSLTERV